MDNEWPSDIHNVRFKRKGHIYTTYNESPIQTVRKAFSFVFVYMNTLNLFYLLIFDEFRYIIILIALYKDNMRSVFG